MSMNINSNYSQFYRGTEQIKTYGANSGGKDTIVRYEFNTTDEQGNKVMDKMSREETLHAMKTISAQYGDNVIVEFSGDGMAALVDSEKKGNLDEIVRTDSAKQAAFNEAVVQMENTHRIVIPNIQTNEKLYSTEVVLTEEIDNHSVYPSDDLLYREFSHGCELEKGTEVFIEKEQVANVLDNALAIGIVLNGEVYKEIPFEDADIQLKLEESGNYVFMAVNEERETVDVTFTIRAEKSADGGVILLK